MSAELPGEGLNEHPVVATPPGLSSEEIQTLRTRAARADELEQAWAGLEPVAPMVKRLLEDERARDFVSTSVSEYDRLEQARKPQMSPEYEALRKELTEEISPIREVALEIQNTRKSELEHRKTQIVQEAREYFQPYMDADPTLQNSELLGQAFAHAQQVAIAKGTSFKDTWAALGGERIMPKREVKQKPPGSLRSSEGKAGIPAAATPPRPEPGKEFNFKQAVADTHRRMQQTRSA